MEKNICELMNELQELTLKLENIEMMEDFHFYNKRINYVRNEIIKMTL